MAFDPVFSNLLPYVGTLRASKPKKVRARTKRPKVRKPRKARIRKPRKIRVIKPKKIRVRKARVLKPRSRSKKAIAAQSGYRMVQGVVVVY